MSDLLMGLGKPTSPSTPAAPGAGKPGSVRQASSDQAQLAEADRLYEQTMSTEEKAAVEKETAKLASENTAAAEIQQAQTTMLRISPEAKVQAANAQASEPSNISSSLRDSAVKGDEASELQRSQGQVRESQPQLSGTAQGAFAQMLQQRQGSVRETASVAVASPMQTQMQSQQLRAGEEPPRSAILNPKTVQSASSMKAASVMAGLQPWSKDWVFTGRESSTPELNTVFKDPSAMEQQANAESGLNDMLRTLLLAKEATGMAQSGSTEASALALQGKRVAGEKIGRGELTGEREFQALSPDAQALLRQVESSGGELQSLQVSSEVQPQAVGVKNPPNAYGGAVAGMSGADFVAAMNASRTGKSDPTPVTNDVASNTSTAGLSREGVTSGLSSFQKAKPAGKNPSGVNATDEFLALSPLAGRTPQSTADIKPLPLQITGHVTQGAMTRERLSSEALSSIGSGIRNLGAQGGGEIRIRLKPENLGELHLRVVTRGNEVGLRIQASDDHSKKIIEESMGYLKESLSANQLSLARVEVTVAQAGASSFLSDSGSQNQNSNAQQNFSSAWDSQQQSSFNGSQQQGASFSERGSQWDESAGDRRLSGSSQARRSTSAIPAQAAGSVGGASRWTTTSSAGGSRLNLFA